MATLDAEDYQNIAEAVVNMLRGINSAPNVSLIQAMGSDDLEAMMDAREREIRSKRKARK